MSKVKQTNKYDVELAKNYRAAMVVAEVGKIVKMIVLGLVVMGCLWVIMDGLENLLVGDDKQILAISEVVDKFGFATIFHVLIEAVLLIALGVTHITKKKAIAEKSNMRKQLEANDPYRGSSGLTPTGGNPE